MSQFFKIHPDNPQGRLLERAAEIIRGGGLLVYPTDACYALGCQIGDKAAMDRISRIRQTGKDHHYTLVCRDLSELAIYATVDNRAYRLLRSLTPGPYTFILQATGEVPRRLQNARRRTIGLRVPEHAIAQGVLEALGEPIMSSTLSLPEDPLPLSDTEEIRVRLEHQVDAIIDGGPCGTEPTTVLELSEGDVTVLRQGKGPTSGLTSSSTSR
jgi:tRNA threonylcarbamoyl adenosine modification protein (Sua5/YciO/YrdC/YwlC family)